MKDNIEVAWNAPDYCDHCHLPFIPDEEIIVFEHFDDTAGIHDHFWHIQCHEFLEKQREEKEKR